MLKRREQTDEERFEDMVISAMETGNTERARMLCKSHEETFPDAVQNVRDIVLRDYSTRI